MHPPTGPLMVRFGMIVLLGLQVMIACAAREVLPTLSDRPLSRDEARAAEAAYEEGLALAQAGNYDAALRQFTLVVEQYPSSRYSALALYWQGRTLYQTRRDSAAADALTRYVDLSPDVPEREHAILLLANSHFNLGHFDRSLSAGLDVTQASTGRLDDFLALARDLLDQLPATTVENASRAEPPRNWLAPFYLQAAGWAFDDGDPERGRSLARQVADFSELPEPLLAEARAMLEAGGGAASLARLGFITPTEGRFTAVAEEIRRGIALALEDLNRGRQTPYELVQVETPNARDSTLGAIRQLSRGQRVQAILGPLTSELALVAGQTAAEEGVTLVSPTATDRRMLDLGPRIYTVNALDGAIGHTIGTYAARNLGRSRFAILEVDDIYGQVQAEAFARAVQAAGAQIVYRTEYTQDETEFTDRLGDIVRSGADAVFIATQSPAEALRILNQIAFFELAGLLPLGTDAWNDEEFMSQGRGFVRGYFADTFSRDSLVTRWSTFAADYRLRYGAEPRNLIPAWGYDATRLALEWLDRPPAGNRDASGRRDARPDPIYRGASALFRITPQGVNRAVVVNKIEGGQPVAIDW